MKEYCSDPICLCHSLLIRTQKKKKAISTVSINGYCVISIVLLLIASYKMSLIGLLACPLALVVKNTPANARDIREVGLIPGSGRSPGGGYGNPLQYSCLENSKDRGASWATVHRVSKSQTRLK